MKALLILLACTGCAAFRGDMGAVAQPDGVVRVRHAHIGSHQNFSTVGALPYQDGGFRLHMSRDTVYVANGTRARIYVDVSCPSYGFCGYPIESLHEQGFAEWGGECSVTAQR